MNEPIDLSVETSPPAGDVEILKQGLTEHSLPFVGEPGFRPVGVFARDGGVLVGGAYGYLNWSWLDVSLLWVAEELRGKGLGSRLLRALERAGRERGCTHAHLNTLGFQAQSFYRRHGYRVFARLEGYARDHQRVFLRKELTESGA